MVASAEVQYNPIGMAKTGARLRLWLVCWHLVPVEQMAQVRLRAGYASRNWRKIESMVSVLASCAG